MIVVTGSRRSGTSAWMQVLVAAGLPVLGRQFPATFARLDSANPLGFYESRLRGGVNFANNPDPDTGHYLHPDDTRLHAVKIFVPGLLRTEYAFLYRVIGTLRHWREQAKSGDALDELTPQNPRPLLPLPVIWWFDLYELLRDAGSRRYPFHLLTYDRLLRDPEREIAHVLAWLGEGDPRAALAAVHPELRHHHRPEVEIDPGLSSAELTVFDEIYEAVDGPGVLSPELLGRANAVQATLRERFLRGPGSVAAVTAG